MRKRRKWNATLRHCLIDDFFCLLLYTHLNPFKSCFVRISSASAMNLMGNNFSLQYINSLALDFWWKNDKTAKRSIVFIYFFHFLSLSRTSNCKFLHPRRSINFTTLEKNLFFSLSRLLESHGICFFFFCYAESLTNRNWEVTHTERRIWK